ncbi:hypothetical protein [Microbacterium memoriense]|uniref:Acyltransferase 3 domain-containing protein n=1 Tax=Microbacterium memoriense TaxID=2978350 RepID=A0ABT2PB79_9MICO|nr:hypothetical protein [Microbacterium memoriense]MCT9001820.1 hypothetical protein [Microbacterium memoriense]
MALALWTAALPFARRVPRSVAIAAFVCIAVARPFLPGEEGSDLYIRMLAYGVFFAVGVCYREQLFSAIDNLRLPLFVAAISGYGITTWVGIATPITAGFTAITFPIQFGSAALLLMYACALACRSGRVATWLSWYGERTLPIYVTHSLIFFALASTSWWGEIVAGNLVMRWGTPLLLAMAASAVGIVLSDLSRGSAIVRLLFSPPASLLHSEAGGSRR